MLNEEKLHFLSESKSKPSGINHATHQWKIKGVEPGQFIQVHIECTSTPYILHVHFIFL